MIKLEMLRVFKAVAEHGSLSKASDKLGRTPSAVSMMLAQLEDHVGDRLFETDRKNRLTPLGALVLDESRRATEAFERSIASIQRHAKSTAGLIRIAAVPSATITLLPKAVSSFRKTHPDVRLEISDLDSVSVARRVHDDEADIGILSVAPGDVQSAEIILTDVLGIVCRRDSAISEAWDRGQRDWAVLFHEPFIANPLCERVKASAVRQILADCNLEARNTTALLAFVRNGIGATVLPESALCNEPELRFLCPQEERAIRHLIKIFSPDRKLSPAAEQFWRQL